MISQQLTKQQKIAIGVAVFLFSVLMVLTLWYLVGIANKNGSRLPITA